MRFSHRSASSTLGKEIALTLVVKLIALWLIWFLCFSNPVKPKLDTQALNQHLLSH